MERIAVIGTGIAGMGAAYFLRDRYDVTFYEKNDYPGGHTNTVSVNEGGREVRMDTGFMVYNEVTYPNLTRLLGELDVRTKPTTMSFSVQHIPTGLEYRGTGLNNLFCQRKNMFKASFIRMLWEVHRFRMEADEVLTGERYHDYTLARYVREKGYSEDFLTKFLVPMSSAVWSTPPGMMLEFPAMALVMFFKNHGFLGLKTQHQWFTVDGGSRHYRDKIMDLFPGKVRLNTPAKKVALRDGRVFVEDGKGESGAYDKVIIASHADEALALLEKPTSAQKDLLGRFAYQANPTVLHTDTALMPRIKRAWSSWNYRIGPDRTGQMQTTTIYDMNSLQKVSERENYFVSINDPGWIDPGKILWKTEYTHPVYTVGALEAQKGLGRLNDAGPVYFCGSYFRYGFHEDALTSAVEAVRALTGRYPDGYGGFAP